MKKRTKPEQVIERVLLEPFTWSCRHSCCSGTITPAYGIGNTASVKTTARYVRGTLRTTPSTIAIELFENDVEGVTLMAGRVQKQASRIDVWIFLPTQQFCRVLSLQSAGMIRAVECTFLALRYNKALLHRVTFLSHIDEDDW